MTTQSVVPDAPLPHTVVVTAEEFRELLTSRRRLIREDEVQRGLCGLTDPVTGERYVVDREQLIALRKARR